MTVPSHVATMLDKFSEQFIGKKNNLTYQSVYRAITSSQPLMDEMELAATTIPANESRAQLLGIELGVGRSGYVDPDTHNIVVGVGLLQSYGGVSTNAFASRVVALFGHETRHTADAHDLATADSNAYQQLYQDSLQPGGVTTDQVTTYINDYRQRHLLDEGLSEITAWNDALVTNQNNGNPLSVVELAKQFNSLFVVSGNSVVGLNGLQTSTDGTIALSQSNEHDKIR